MVTITAPGADWLPWDLSLCTAPAGHRCSGRLGCRPEAWAADDWNRSAPGRLSLLLDAAHNATGRRGFRRGNGRPAWLAVPDLQARGLLHWHYLFAAADRPYVTQLCRELARLAPQYGFGKQVDFSACLEHGRSKGMAYIVKAAQYVSKAAGDAGGGQREQLASMLGGPLAGRPFLRASPKLTRCSRVTMRNLRDRRTLYARGKGAGLSCEVVERVMLIERELERRDRQEREVVAALFRAFEDLPPPSWTARAARVRVPGVDYDRRLFGMTPAKRRRPNVNKHDAYDPFRA